MDCMWAYLKSFVGYICRTAYFFQNTNTVYRGNPEYYTNNTKSTPKKATEACEVTSRANEEDEGELATIFLFISYLITVVASDCICNLKLCYMLFIDNNQFNPSFLNFV
jgi:hypothetical protein